MVGDNEDPDEMYSCAVCLEHGMRVNNYVHAAAHHNQLTANRESIDAMNTVAF
jgi:hypothetical protein